MDFLGWYTTGDTPTEKDIAVHRQICDINECPVMLMLNPAGMNGDVSQVKLKFMNIEFILLMVHM